MTSHHIKQFASVLLLIFLFVQCKTMKENRHDIKDFKTTYLYQFKLTYTRKLLQTGFNYSASINKILETDPQGFTERILSDADYHLIDSLVYMDNQIMKTDSTNRIGMVAEGAEGKHVIFYLINKYESKWIDSVAKVRYKNLGVKKFE
jgi:hypothetical protein